VDGEVLGRLLRDPGRVDHRGQRANRSDDAPILDGDKDRAVIPSDLHPLVKEGESVNAELLGEGRKRIGHLAVRQFDNTARVIVVVVAEPLEHDAGPRAFRCVLAPQEPTDSGTIGGTPFP
jgi:hypothetical protein